MLNKKLFIFIVFFCLFLTLASCNKDKLNMIVPYGAPQFAQLYMQESNDYDVTIVQGADPLVAAFASESYDVIIAPTNLGAKLYQSKPVYQLAASITWGNYYLISKDFIALDDLEDQEIIAFGQNQTPDAILQYVLDDSSIHITYLDSLSSVVSEFLLDGSQIYLVAEPSLSLIEASHTVNVIDIKQLYQDKTGRDSFPQASVFVHHKLSDDIVDKIKNDIKNSIEKTLNKLDETALLAIELGIQMDQEIIKSSFLNSNILYKSSDDAKEDIIVYLEMLRAFNVNFTGEHLPEDAFYR